MDRCRCTFELIEVHLPFTLEIDVPKDSACFIGIALIGFHQFRGIDKAALVRNELKLLGEVEQLLLIEPYHRVILTRPELFVSHGIII